MKRLLRLFDLSSPDPGSGVWRRIERPSSAFELAGWLVAPSVVAVIWGVIYRVVS